MVFFRPVIAKCMEKVLDIMNPRNKRTHFASPLALRYIGFPLYLNTTGHPICQIIKITKQKKKKTTTTKKTKDPDFFYSGRLQMKRLQHENHESK